ncbi:TraR/DksA C4-type zinc finger protein [Streptomyces sp. NPDC051219]|uniref:TraR/DksA family transcriptional regulator n=1 Tax=Streptomyces sp. NPDC051219 TaxID=3155283 RepID=UPI00344A1EBE
MPVRTVDLHAVRAMLNAQAERLRRELADSETVASVLYEDCDLDAADAGATTTSLDQLRSGRDRAGFLLALTVAAVGRLDDGTYGLCLTCGRPMDRERMLAVPHLKRCVRCQDDRSRQ